MRGVLSGLRSLPKTHIPTIFVYGFIVTTLVGLAVAGYITLSRVAYPFELEWMEGPGLLQVGRILSGKPIYVEPTLEYIPMIYAPLYFYISAGSASVFGLSFLSLRLVSLASTIGILLLVYRIVWEKTRLHWAACGGVGLLVLLFPATNWWIDVARVDTLFTFFLVLMFWLLQQKHWGKAGLAFGLALWTKQTGLVILPAVLLYLALTDWRALLRFVGVGAATFGIPFLVLNNYTDGWAAYYMFWLPAQHDTLAQLPMLLHHLRVDYIAPLLLIFAYMAELAIRTKVWRNLRSELLVVCVLPAFIVLSLLARLNIGGYHNALWPAYTAIAVLFGRALATSWRVLPNRAMGSGRLRQIAFLSLAFCQMVALLAIAFSNIASQIPTAADARFWQEKMDLLRIQPGRVFLPSHNYLLDRVGRPSGFHTIAILEFDTTFGRGDPQRAEALRRQIDAVYNAADTVVILNNIPDEKITPNQPKTMLVSRSAMEGRPVVGYRVRPEVAFGKVNIPKSQ
jgi:hypothetical protein